ncbi:metal-dependent phosphohydrolase [Sporolactobacillus shoreicorticis]|uniref:HD-GYP domain-containing protein n=1 Tax=Sporolactobacillus shoreicorticis TaxID=1923877 RepID=A0ABW5SA24_9BACL|nr:HD domain-containing phosphohydrolase [Sporolactobacillus shoreicorticis]MCO7126109.1 metal-dependent phosphohydrolase [Sporolactobacillus shoreicorticis]
MIVTSDELKAGCILRKDVYSKSVKPLMKAGTVLNETHIAFLRAFLIKHVDVDHFVRSSVKRSVKKNSDLDLENSSLTVPKPEATRSPLDKKYHQSVSDYQHFFYQWQSGAGVSIGDFRAAMMPLITGALDDPMWLASHLIKHRRIPNIAERSVLFGLLATFFAKKSNLGSGSGDSIQLGLAGMLADCGLAKLSPSLLGKKELIGSEKNTFERHVIDSYKMLKGIPTLKDETLVAVIQHHEREDGSGFPLNIDGSQISMNGKILAICDGFLTQMTIERSGSLPTVLDHLRISSYGRLSRYLLDKFCYELMTLFVGMNVQLSDGQAGEITFIPAKEPTRPMIHLTDNRVYALTEFSNVTIDRFL